MNVDSVQHLCGWIMEFLRKVGGLVVVGVAMVIWAPRKSRNRACFDIIYPYDPSSIITHSVYWPEFWKLLQRRELQGARVKGARLSCGWQLIFSIGGWVGRQWPLDLLNVR